MAEKKTLYNDEWVDEITCKMFVEWVTDYLEGALPADERKRFEAHLAQCSACPHYLEQIKQTIQIAGKLSDTLDEVSPAARSSLLSLFKRMSAGDDE